jgi:creatinine amidohydrolase
MYGHADEFEVSSTLGLCPQYVRENRVKGEMQNSLYSRGFTGGAFSWKYDATLNGALGDARMATMEIGKRMTEEALGIIEKLIEEIIAR